MGLIHVIFSTFCIYVPFISTVLNHYNMDQMVYMRILYVYILRSDMNSNMQGFSIYELVPLHPRF